MPAITPRTALFVGALLVSIGACKKDKGSESTESVVSQTPSTATEESAPPDDAAPTPIANETVNTADFVTASNALGMDLYRAARAEPGNLVFSPPSIELAFAMTYAGAANKTAEEMRAVLHLDESDAIHSSAASLLKSWNEKHDSYQLRVVNRLFGEKNYSFQTSFLDRVASSYDAPLESLDFANQPQEQRKHINDWVMQQTEDRIDELLPEESITKDTRLVLVNAIYFLGTWTHSFDAARTSDVDFWVEGTKKSKVPTMAQTAYFKYAEGTGFKVLELPYKDSTLAMTIVLPDSPTGLAAVEAELSMDNFSSWLEPMTLENISVHLPRFELKNARLKLVDILEQLGMIAAFAPDSADFSLMAKPASADDELYISSAFHEAFIKVDEKGTEAAAATAVVMAVKGGMPAPPKNFHVDHPFVFAIRDTESNAILFIGRVVNPG